MVDIIPLVLRDYHIIPMVQRPSTMGRYKPFRESISLRYNFFGCLRAIIYLDLELAIKSQMSLASS